jgi:hypothetical protein
MEETIMASDRAVPAVLPGQPQADQPLLYQKREYLAATPNMARTTSCQSTSNPTDYGPDD